MVANKTAAEEERAYREHTIMNNTAHNNHQPPKHGSSIDHLSLATRRITQKERTGGEGGTEGQGRPASPLAVTRSWRGERRKKHISIDFTYDCIRFFNSESFTVTSTRETSVAGLGASRARCAIQEDMFQGYDRYTLIKEGIARNWEPNQEVRENMACRVHHVLVVFEQLFTLMAAIYVALFGLSHERQCQMDTAARGGGSRLLTVAHANRQFCCYCI